MAAGAAVDQQRQPERTDPDRVDQVGLVVYRDPEARASQRLDRHAPAAPADLDVEGHSRSAAFRALSNHRLGAGRGTPSAPSPNGVDDEALK